MPFAVGGAIAAAGAIGGALISSSASKSAGNQAAAAQQQSANLQKAMYDQTRADLLPYNQWGQNNLPLFQTFYNTTSDQLNNAFDVAQAHIPQPMTEANLIQTPGYQFNLSQGQRAIANANAAKGLGVSGAALQGAAKYATGLADSTYQNQFANQQQIYNDYLSQANLKGTQLNSIFSQISAPVSLGENAAATSGNQAVNFGQNIGNALANVGNAQAAGTTGSANALANGLQSIGNAGNNAATNYLGFQQALGGGGGGGNAGFFNNPQFGALDGQGLY